MNKKSLEDMFNNISINNIEDAYNQLFDIVDKYIDNQLINDAKEWLDLILELFRNGLAGIYDLFQKKVDKKILNDKRYLGLETLLKLKHAIYESDLEEHDKQQKLNETEKRINEYMQELK